MAPQIHTPIYQVEIPRIVYVDQQTVAEEEATGASTPENKALSERKELMELVIRGD